jgi:preprotein translocase subunit SecG
MGGQNILQKTMYILFIILFENIFLLRIIKKIQVLLKANSPKI